MLNLKSLKIISKKTIAVLTSAALTAVAIPTEARADAVLRGNLYRGRVGWITLNDMASNQTFRIVGTCDYDCSDMDFHLYDGNYNLVDRDILSDDTPIVSARPRWQGDFYLKVSIPRCSTSYCNYRVYVDD